VRDHHRTAAHEQSRDLERGGWPIEPVPALPRTDHIEPTAGQAGCLRPPLDISDPHTGPAIQPPGLFQQRRGHVYARDLAPTLREQPREAPRPGAEVHDTRATAHDTDRREAIEQFGREARTVTGVVIGGTAEIRRAVDHRASLRRLDSAGPRARGLKRQSRVPAAGARRQGGSSRFLPAW